MTLLRRWVDPADIQAVFLDVGNTLVFLDYEAIAGTVRQHGIHVTPSEIERAEYAARRRADRRYAEGGHREDGMWELYFFWILETAGVPEVSAPEILKRLREKNEQSNLWRCSGPDIVRALERVGASGRSLAVVSNSDGSCREILRRLNLLDYLDAVYDSAVVGVEKPDPRIFQLALKELDLRPEETLHIGDLESVDIVGARRAGILPVLVEPFPSERRIEFPTIQSAAHLPAVLEIETQP